MSVQTSVNGFNVGTDVSFAIMDEFGDVFSDSMMGLLTQFDLQSVDVRMTVTPINRGGRTVHQTIPNGLRGTMTFVRTNSAFHQMYVDLSNGYYDGGIIPQFSIAMHIRNRNGTVDQYLIDGVQFSEWHFGDFRSTKEVDLRLSIQASAMYGSGSLATFLNSL